MLDLYTKLQTSLANEDGQTMAEYGVVLAVGFLSGAISGSLNSVASQL